MLKFRKINRLLMFATALLYMSLVLAPTAQGKNHGNFKLICGFVSGTTTEGEAFASALCKSLERDLKRELGLDLLVDQKKPAHIIEIKVNTLTKYTAALTLAVTVTPGEKTQTQEIMLSSADQPLAANASRNLIRPIAVFLGLL